MSHVVLILRLRSFVAANTYATGDCHRSMLRRNQLRRPHGAGGRCVQSRRGPV